MEARSHVAVQDFFEVETDAFGVQGNEETNTDHVSQHLKWK